ncbi:hypothetical protein [Sphingobacterium pedocola]|uniref:Uncharacterized protein n=1 Tax=Sphingobacterium pedocola TaxID=2082722 RepID=A0ABR9T3M3_9SPHI|nr:hypothetical protein [Sphingobacterium pedocola]MBE8719955.1 hypothetical protein [Sphingobacterium pedocola]
MNKQFAFTSLGVDEWQYEVYQLGQTGIDQECALIRANFVDWVCYRFSLSAEQREFVISLGVLAQESYGTSLENVLQHRGNITLDKDENRKQRATAQNPKVVIWEERLQRVQSQSVAVKDEVDPDYTVSLAVRIFYLENA